MLPLDLLYNLLYFILYLYFSFSFKVELRKFVFVLHAADSSALETGSPYICALCAPPLPPNHLGSQTRPGGNVPMADEGSREQGRVSLPTWKSSLPPWWASCRLGGCEPVWERDEDTELGLGSVGRDGPPLWAAPCSEISSEL